MTERLLHRLPRFWPLGLWAALGILVLSGCGASNPYPPASFERGEFFAEHGQDLEAVTALEDFIRRNPTDSLAAEAQYLKGQSYMELEEYPLAAVEFQILRKDYPISERVQDAMFQEALCYYRQVGRIERDVTGAYEARLQFLRFSQEYPDSPRMPDVRQYMQEISDLMVRKRLKQAKVYRQLKRDVAVAVTLDQLLENEAGSSLIPEVIWERAQVAIKLDDPDTAGRMLERLIYEFPDTEYGPRAQGALRKLDGEEDGDEEEEEL